LTYNSEVSKAKSTPFGEIMQSERPILALDIGGTKLATGLVSPDGKLLYQTRRPTPPVANADELFAVITAMVQNVLAEAEKASATPDKMGVGCGGPMLYPAGIVSPLHIPIWQSFPLRERLRQTFKVPVVVDNDAKAFALGEAIFGAGRGARALLGMIVSTGVGGGLVFDGKLLHGASGNAGHIGHFVVTDKRRSPRCHCGAVGCLTAYASGQGMVERARDLLRYPAYRASPLQAIGENLSAAIIAQAAQEGDRLATRLFTDAGQALGRAIAGSAALLDLDRVVLGGGIVQSGDLLLKPFRAELQSRAQLSFTRDLDVRIAELGIENAGLIGAAALALTAEETEV
jgi:glucokinase